MDGARRPAPAERYAIGRHAEDAAAAHVEAAGFRVLWRNVRIGPLEIDLVAKRADLVIIVEVRSRGSHGRPRFAGPGPLASITWKKRQMLLRAARGLWRGRLKKMPDVLRVRIDVIAVTPGDAGAHLEWIEGAITES